MVERRDYGRCRNVEAPIVNCVFVLAVEYWMLAHALRKYARSEAYRNSITDLDRAGIQKNATFDGKGDSI